MQLIMKLFVHIALLFIVLDLALAVGAPRAGGSSAIPPPAGRALLSRGADLQPYDYPASAQSGFNHQTHIHPLYPVTGPPGFWTEPSLRQHYASTLRLRYHPLFYPTPPPFEVWFKEQQLIRAINMLKQTIELEASRRDLDASKLLRHEMLLGELSVLLRLTQTATALRYAVLVPEWRRYEESWYRHWAAFLQVSQSGVGEAKAGKSAADWQKHLAYLDQLARKSVQEEEQARQAAFRDAKVRGKKRMGEEARWREIPIETSDVQSGTPRRWNRPPDIEGPASDGGGKGYRAGVESSTPQRWQFAPPIVADNSGKDVVDSLQDAFGKGFRI